MHTEEPPLEPEVSVLADSLDFLIQGTLMTHLIPINRFLDSAIGAFMADLGFPIEQVRFRARVLCHMPPLL